jgi:hypothetical protein
MAELRLTIELVPATSWYNNLRKNLPRAEWDRIRQQVYADYNYRCGICGAKGQLSCHERWEYNDSGHTQKLAGFIALCTLCHHVKHIGLAGILAGQGKLDYDKVVEHFISVNGCDRKSFQAHKHQAFQQWQERSEHPWTVDLGKYQALTPEQRCAHR